MNEEIDRMMLQFWPQPAQYDNAVDYYRACAIHLATHADANDVVLTVTQLSVPPLAMRNYVTVIETREKR